MSSTPDYASDGTTLVEIIRQLEDDGYDAQFTPGAGGTLRCLSCRNTSPAGLVHLERLRRTEGASDPDDMVAVAALRCPSCGRGGTVALKYGPEATPEDAEVLSQLES